LAAENGGEQRPGDGLLLLDPAESSAVRDRAGPSVGLLRPLKQLTARV
jgi:hypothetical protein